MPARILLLTGINPSHRVFDRLLPLLPQATVITWIEPQHRESLSSYARRLAVDVRATNDTVVCGVSFGGVVARELALRLNARACVLISTVRTERELPPWVRLLRPLAGLEFDGMLAMAGRAAAICPRRIRQPSTARFRQFAGRDGGWRRWATTALMQWSASPALDAIPTIQIHGDQDQTFPLRYTRPEIVLPGGGHLIALTHANEIADVVRNVAA